MAATKEVDELSEYIGYYLRKVIGVGFPLVDGSQPSVTPPPDQKIVLPVSWTTLGAFLGPGFVLAASKELLFSIVVGLAYHEVAHLHSGEEKVEPHVLNNLVCEANDFTFVPETWKGSIPFTLAIVNVDYRRGRDLVDIPLNTKEDKLGALLHLAISFLRKLRVKHNGKDIRSLPEDHPLYGHFERTKPIVKEARRCPVSGRPELVRKLFDVVKEFWEEQEKKEQAAQRSDEQSDADRGNGDSIRGLSRALGDGDAPLSMNQQLTQGDAQQMDVDLKASNTLKDIQEKMSQIQQGLQQEKQEETLSQVGTFIEGPYDLKEIRDLADLPARTDPSILAEVRRILKPLLYERSLARRGASIVGSTFNPSRFYEIKTNPDAPKVRKEIRHMAKVIDEALVILCFDRSGSMSGSKEDAAVQIAATLYRALCGIPKLQVLLLGFNDFPVLIKGERPLPTDTVLRRIPVGLKAQGGTNLPLAFKECIRLALEHKAQKKLVILLTDGDLSGSFDPEKVVEYAQQGKIDTVCIGVKGTDRHALQRVFGRSGIYVDGISKLPNELEKAVIGRI